MIKILCMSFLGIFAGTMGAMEVKVDHAAQSAGAAKTVPSAQSAETKETQETFGGLPLPKDWSYKQAYDLLKTAELLEENFTYDEFLQIKWILYRNPEVWFNAIHEVYKQHVYYFLYTPEAPICYFISDLQNMIDDAKTVCPTRKESFWIVLKSLKGRDVSALQAWAEKHKSSLIRLEPIGIYDVEEMGALIRQYQELVMIAAFLKPKVFEGCYFRSKRQSAKIGPLTFIDTTRKTT